MNYYLDTKDCIEIKRKGFVPKGEYCSRCIYLRTSIDRKHNIIGYCTFWEDILSTTKATAPCGEEFDEYNKCLNCRLQEIIEKGKNNENEFIEKIAKRLAEDFYCPVLCSTKKLKMQEYCDNHTCSENNQECWRRYLEKIIKGE